MECSGGQVCLFGKIGLPARERRAQNVYRKDELERVCGEQRPGPDGDQGLPGKRRVEEPPFRRKNRRQCKS